MSESGTVKAVRMIDKQFDKSMGEAMAEVAVDQPKTFRARVADVVTQARLVRDVAQKMLAAAEAQVLAAEAAARELEQ